MGNFQVGETVAVNLFEDQFIKWAVYTFDHLETHQNYYYKKHSRYKRCKIKKVKRLWHCFFKRMYLLDDGWWYSERQLTPIVRVKASIAGECIYE